MSQATPQLFTIAIGSDHAGFAYKEAIKAALLAAGHASNAAWFRVMREAGDAQPAASSNASERRRGRDTGGGKIFMVVGEFCFAATPCARYDQSQTRLARLVSFHRCFSVILFSFIRVPSRFKLVSRPFP